MKKKAKKVVKAIQKKAKKREEKAKRKEDKKNEKILKLVKGEFGDALAEPIAEAVVVNKNLLKRDEKKLKEWQEEYYMSLFMKFKKMIIEHNEAMGFKNIDLSVGIDKKERKIKLLKQELGKLKEDVKSLKIEKGILVDA